MYITLSSNGERDNAKFSNEFSEGFVIEPNSYITLISASVIQDIQNQEITLPAMAQATIRFDPFNFFPGVLNTVVTTYTIQSLIDRFNALFEGQIYYNRRFNCSFTMDPNNPTQGQFVFKLYMAEPNDLPAVPLLEWIYGSAGTQTREYLRMMDYYYFMKIYDGNIGDGFVNAQVSSVEFDNNILKLVPTVPGGVGQHNNAWFFDPIFSGDGKDFGMNGPINGGTFQINKFLNDADDLDPLNEYSIHQFTIAAPSDLNSGVANRKAFYFGLGKSTHVGLASDTITDGPLPGQLSHGRASLLIDFNANGSLTVQVNNTNTGNFDLITDADPLAHIYFPGDVYRISTVPDTNQVNDPSEMLAPRVVRQDYHGLVYWIPGSVNSLTHYNTTAHNWNSRQAKPWQGVKYLYALPALTTATIKSQYFTSSAANCKADNCVLGCWGTQGWSDTAAGSRTNPFFSAAVSRTMQIESFPPTPAPIDNFRQALPVFYRVHNPDAPAPSDNASEKNIIRLNTDIGNQSSLYTNLPCCMTFLVYFIDDRAFVNSPYAEKVTVVGGLATNLFTQQPCIQVSPANLSAFDVIVWDADGTNRQLTLLQGGVGARINIQYGQWYMCAYNDDGAGNFRFQMAELFGALPSTYYADNTHQGPNLKLAQPMALGGMSNFGLFNSADYYFNGHISQFKFFQKCRGDTRANLWDIDVNLARFGYQESAGVIAPGPAERLNFCYSIPTEYQLFNPVNYAGQYFNITDFNSNESTTPAFCYEQADVTYAPGQGFVTDPLFIPAINIPHAQRQRTILESEVSDYGTGLTRLATLHAELDFDDYDAVNDRVINEYFVPPGVGIANGTFNQMLADIDTLDLDDEIYNVEIQNLPHRSFNGKTKSIDKTIYQLPIESVNDSHGNKITELTVPQKVWIPLKNPGIIPINKLDVQISNEDGTKAVLSAVNDTHLTVQIETRENIL